jgi:hypothetical protein
MQASMSDIIKLIPRIALGVVCLIASHATFEIFHLCGWYPEQQLAVIVMVSPQTSFWVLSTVAAIIMWVGVDYFIYRRNKTLKADWPIAAPLMAVRNDALKITLGETADFEHTQPRLDYVIRTVLACVGNVDPSHFISNCKAGVEINGIDHSLVDCFTLNPIEKRFIPIAFRHESPIDKFIHICAIPKPGGIGGIQYRPTFPLSGGLITIKATSAETKPAQLVCRVFVDDSGKLKLEKA